MVSVPPSKTAQAAPRPLDLLSGARRPSTGSSSPNAKEDCDSQQAKKKVRAMDLQQPNWTEDVIVEDVLDELPETEEIPKHAMPDLTDP
ncbi:hypothetical protein LINGRAHAP2_LOCUS2168 [Linum grandiflorum]